MPVTQKRKPRVEWNPEWAPLLGTMSDRAVGAAVGMAQQSIRQIRFNAGIAPFGPAGARLRERPADLTADALQAMTLDQAVVRYGASKPVIVRWRRELGIRRHAHSTTPTAKTLRAHYHHAAVAGMLAACEVNGDTIATIGRVLGVTRERARQLVEECRERVVAAADGVKRCP